MENDVKKQYVSDQYFTKGGRPKIKLCQTVVGMLMWSLLALPILITVNSLAFRKTKGIRFIPKWDYLEGIESFLETCSFVLLMGSGAVVIYILMAIRNNWLIKNRFQKQTTYSAAEINRKKQLLEQEHQQRFEERPVRENLKFYSVKEEQNFGSDFFENLYMKKGA